MPLNKSQGNMYNFVSHTWNTVKGQCFHDCSYCYCKAIAKRFNSAQKPVHFDEKELKTNLGSDNFIFVGSSCDMWAEDIPESWILRTLIHCDMYDNKYLFQTKNPERIRRVLPENSSVCVTIETNRHYPEVMGKSPTQAQRFFHSKLIRHPLYITIEPIMDFDLVPFVDMLQQLEPLQVNIGANSGNIKIPEPPKEKVLQLIEELQKFTVIHNKSNLKRLLKIESELTLKMF